MSVDELLDTMEDEMDASRAIPLSGKRMVDVDRMHDLIDEVRRSLPDEIRQAKAIVNDRSQILSDAKREAESLVQKAEDRARSLVSQEQVVRDAQRRAAEILQTAQNQGREVSASVTTYCENMLRISEEQLAKATGEMKATRANLRQAAKGKGGAGSDPMA